MTGRHLCPPAGTGIESRPDAACDALCLAAWTESREVLSTARVNDHDILVVGHLIEVQWESTTAGQTQRYFRMATIRKSQQCSPHPSKCPAGHEMRRSISKLDGAGPGSAVPSAAVSSRRQHNNNENVT